MMDPHTAYYFKKYYRNVIKWWFVLYNPEAKKIWPSKAEEEEALRKEQEELEALAMEEDIDEAIDEAIEEFPISVDSDSSSLSSDAYNETTGSFSGLYGQGPMDEDTQSILDEIMNNSSSQNSIDSLIHSAPAVSPASDVIIPPEQEEIIREANAIYERLLREAKEDEEKKIAAVQAALKEAELKEAASS